MMANGRPDVPTEINWQKSSFSGTGDDNNCVEVGATSTCMQIRESDAPATVLSTTPTQLRALIAAIKSRVID